MAHQEDIEERNLHDRAAKEIAQNSVFSLLRNSRAYWLKLVPPHFGQGGSVSVSSSRVTACPQLVQ